MGKVVRLQPKWSVEALLELFLFEKRAEGKAPRTVKDYEYHVSVFFRRFPLSLSSAEALRKAVLEYFAEEVKPATFNLRRKYLRVFFDFLVREGVIAKNPVDFPERKDEGRARAVPEGVLRKLLEAPDRKTSAGLRDYVLI
ncbi:MAG: site-specific integrase, partial [Atribacterota bacterium]|nr:site-specific integrase [Atribacterota bacterium]